MLFESKSYRNSFPKERFKSFEIENEDGSLWIGVDPDSFKEEMIGTAQAFMTEKLNELAAYIAEEPFFRKSLKPCPVTENAPDIAHSMAAAGELAVVGPMAAKNAILAELVGKMLLERFEIGELIVENGGDLYLKLQNSLIVSIFAGDSDISGMVGIEIQPGQTPLGIGTGTGTKGTPMNHGAAEAVFIVAKKAAEAGAFAVGLGNKIKSPEDVDKVLMRIEIISEIEGAVLILDDQIGLRGDIELIMLS